MNLKTVSPSKNGMKRQTKPSAKILFQLFWSMFSLSACTFGGGFVIVSLMRKKFVTDLKWLSEEEMLDITAIAQSSPGPIPVNASVIVGYKMCGLAGSIAAVLGTALPPTIIISIISIFYTQFRENHVISTALAVMRAGVAAVIIDVAISLGINVIKSKSILCIVLMFVAFILVYVFDVSAIIIILSCLAIGIADVFVIKRKKGEIDK